MTAYIEVYEGGRSIIKIEDASGAVVDRYEVSAIRVELSASAIRPSGPINTMDLSNSLIVISGARN